MNATLSAPLWDGPATPSLDDKYTLGQGRIYLSRTQVLVRLPMLQKERD